MSVKKLCKTEWGPFFDKLSRTLKGARAELDAMSLSIGSQTEAKWLPLMGVTYDAKDDVLELVMDGLDHLIHQPEDIFFEEDGGLLTSLQVIDREQTSYVLKLKGPVSAPV